jgi:hypothetical protein
MNTPAAADSYERYEAFVLEEMRRNGHPRLCLAKGEVTESEIEAFCALLESARDEKPLQAFLQEHPAMLTFQLGHQCRWIISQVKLGRLVPDFIGARLDSTGLNWTLIELESPLIDGLYTREKTPKRQLAKGLHQIRDWRDWLRRSAEYAGSSSLAGGLGLVGLTDQAAGLVLIGRRSDRTDKDRALIQRDMYDLRIDIHSYDWLIDQARASIRLQEHECVDEDGLCSYCGISPASP